MLLIKLRKLMCKSCGDPNHLIGNSFVKAARKVIGSDSRLEFNILEQGEEDLFERSPNRDDYNNFIPVSQEEANFIREVMIELNQITGIELVETNDWEESWLVIFQTDYYPDYKQDIGWLNNAKSGSLWLEASWAHGKGYPIPDSLQNWERGTIRHELGHALGLQHPQGKANNKNYTLKDSIMSYRGDSDKYYGFTELDKQALRKIWGNEGGSDVITGLNGLAEGTSGNDFIVASPLGDEIYSGKGIDSVTCGEGEDWVWLSKRSERGAKNYDVIKEFDVGNDWIGIFGNAKGLYIDQREGDAWILKGNHPLAIIKGAGGSVDWVKDGGTWWVG